MLYIITLESKLQIWSFQLHFKNNVEITYSDIFDFYVYTEPEISGELVRKRIVELVKKGILLKKGKGIYALGNQINYIPVFEPSLIRMYKKLIAKFPYAKLCIWNTRQLNEFMLHQPGRFYTIVETEKDVSEFAFNFLNDFNKNVFQANDKSMIEKYAIQNTNSIIIKDLTSESPVHTISKIQTPTLEKILVDIFCDKDLFVAQQGSELNTIYQTAFDKYSINKSKLLRYAKRRGKNEIAEFISSLNL